MRYVLLFIIAGINCHGNPVPINQTPSADTAIVTSMPKNTARVIHVYVALCDNKNQRIVPVPAGIGNGQQAATNLYWGCAGGVKGYLQKSTYWKLVKTHKNPAKNILERCVFKHRQINAWLVADAYDGAAIKQCITDFFTAAAGKKAERLQTDAGLIDIGGSAQLVAYTGHNGLMDFSLNEYPQQSNAYKRSAIMLSCISKRYFAAGIRAAGATPLLWSTGLMSPEAYTLEAALEGWLKQEDGEQVRLRAAKTYHRYQHCGLRAATRLLATGW